MEHGTFSVDTASRRVRGILVPWGERSRTSASKTKPITFPRGSIRVPRDPSVVGLNFAHDRFSPVGRGAHFEDQEAGLYAEFDIADTPEGDAWLAERGEFVKLSAEVRNIQRDETDNGTAELTGAALVSEGAFASAALFAIDVEVVDADDEHPEIQVEDLPEDITVTAADGETVTYTPESSTDDEDTEADPESEEDKEDAVAEFATVPGSLPQGRTEAKKEDQPKLTFGGFINALFAARTAGDAGRLAPYIASTNEVGLFALTDVTYDTAGASAFTQAAWLGELWRATPDVRTFIPSVGSQALTDLKMTGFTLDVGEDAIDTWAGNKAAIPSDDVTFDSAEFVAQRFAGGNDLAREYWDFNKTQVIEAYVRKMVELYQRKSDAYALTQTLAGATTGTPGTVPSGADAGMTAVIDLALAVQAAGGTPNVVRVAPDLYRSMLLQLDGNQFAYLAASFGLPSGDAAGLDIRSDARLAASQVLVADRNGIGVWELPGSPIRVDAVNIANGGIDKGFFGYIAAGVIDSSVVLKATIGA